MKLLIRKETEFSLLIDVVDDKNHIIAYAKVVNTRNSLTYINDLHVFKQNNGIGTMLLNRILQYKYIKPLLHVSDFSSNYRKHHNIYIKFGFKYVEPKSHLMSKTMHGIK